MNALITGANGFIGSHLYKRLKSKGHNVVGIDNLSHPCGNKVETKYADVRYIKELLPYFCNCDIVYHLAAQINVDKSISDPEETIATNIIGTQNILELARRFGIKIVFASTSEVYGSSECEFMTEEHPLNGQSPYAASKTAGDRLCYAYYKTFGTNVSIVRNFNTFGEYQNTDSYGGVISKFTLAALKDEPLIIYGNGSQQRDYMSINDALQAYEIMSETPKGTICNFGTGKTVNVLEIANLIKDILGSKSTIERIEPRKGEVQRLCAGIDKARSLGFNPKTDFRKDLERYILWLKNEISHFTN